MKVYINGVQDPITVSASGTLSGTQDINIGRDVNAVAANFDGRIDEIDLYHRALSPTEVQAIYNAGSAGKIKPVAGVGEMFLVFSSAPAKAAHGFAFAAQPTVGMTNEDAQNVPIPAGTLVTLSIQAGTGSLGAALTCAANPVAAGGGSATFSGCAIDLAGEGYVLEATAEGASAGVSQPINIVWAGDASRGCQVDIVDFSVLARAFGTSQGPAGYDLRADFDGDGQVDALDFSKLATFFGSRCPSLTAIIAVSGTQLSVEGHDYLPHREVRFTTNGAAATPATAVIADGNGHFTAKLPLPASGPAVVTASQLTALGGKVIGAAVLTVPGTSLPQSHWVDIHDPAPRQDSSLQQVVRLAAKQDDLPAVAAAQAGGVGRHRPDDIDRGDAHRGGSIPQASGQRLGLVLGVGGVRMGEHQPGHAAEGRISVAAAVGHFLVEEQAVVLLGGRGDGIVLRGVGLNDHRSRPRAASGAARHLSQQLKGTLRGPEVRQIEVHVSIDDPYQRDLREVQPLRDHLCAHQDVGVVRLEPAQHCFVGMARTSRVPVPAEHASLRAESFHLVLDPLRTDSEKLDARTAALRTDRRNRGPRIALVAQQPFRGRVIGKGQVAAAAGHGMTAVAALHEG